MKCIIFFFATIFIFSCTNRDPIISDIESEGYTYIEECAPPYGIRDTLILGYTDRINGGIFHLREFRPKDLKIKGYKFEKVSDENWESTLMVYQFEFGNKEEVNQFGEFQGFLVNYQRHIKNKAEVFQKDSIWFLRFEPMP